MAAQAKRERVGRAVNLVDALILADVITFDEIDFSQQAPAPLLSGPMVIKSRCVKKVPGELRFTLNTIRDLNLQQPYDFDIHFVGTPSPTGTPVVQWSVDDQIDKYYGVPGEPVDAHIWDVRGSVTTRLDAISPAQNGQSCDGSARLFPVKVGMAAGQNQLVVRGDVVTEGAHLHLEDFTIDINNVSVAAEAGFVPRRVVVAIVPENGACGSGGAIPGGHVWFSAVVVYDTSTTLAFKWSVQGSGAAPAAKVDGQWFEVVLGDAPGTVTVSVTVTADDGSTTTHSLDYTPQTSAEAAVARLSCVLMEFKIPPAWIGDPDLLRGVTSRTALRSLNTFAGRLLSVTRQLLQREAAVATHRILGRGAKG